MKNVIEYKFKSLPECFFNRVKESGDEVGYIYHDGKEWRTIKWKELGELVKKCASALIALGINKGDRVNVFGYNSLEWVIADFGILTAGGVVVPIYHTLPADQAGYIIKDCEGKIVFVENSVALDKVKSLKGELPDVKKVVVFKGLQKGDGDWVMTFDEFLKIGEEKYDENKIQERLGNINLDDLACFVYTSGTTGPPKGVMQTHRNHLAMAEMLYSIKDFRGDDVLYLFLPVAHSFARAAWYGAPFIGYKTIISRGIDKVIEDVGQTKPTILPSVPRIFEKVYDAVHQSAQASPLKRIIFNWAVKVGKERSKYIINKKPIPFFLSLKYKIAFNLVFKKLHQRLGGNIRFFISGGAPLSAEIAEFFHAADLLIIEGYGLTETTPALTINRLDNYKFGTVGLPLPGVEIKIAEDGEILARGPNIALGYFKKEEDTKEAFRENGWFHTGDIGEFDPDGFLKITDRKKDIIVTAGGKNIAPQIIENMIKAESPLISQVVMIGDKKPYCVALVSLNEEELKNWAKIHAKSNRSIDELVRDEEVKEEVKRVIEKVNSKLASYETIKKFRIVPKDFTIERGELTPTLKVKRKVVMERYKDLIEEMYSS